MYKSTLKLGTMFLFQLKISTHCPLSLVETKRRLDFPCVLTIKKNSDNMSECLILYFCCPISFKSEVKNSTSFHATLGPDQKANRKFIDSDIF